MNLDLIGPSMLKTLGRNAAVGGVIHVSLSADDDESIELVHRSVPIFVCTEYYYERDRGKEEEVIRSDSLFLVHTYKDHNPMGKLGST